MSGLQRMSSQYEKCDSVIDGAAAKPSLTKQICESFASLSSALLYIRDIVQA